MKKMLSLFVMILLLISNTVGCSNNIHTTEQNTTEKTTNSTISTISRHEITDSDSGTFVLLGKDQKPVDLYYRLSRKEGKWVMEGKDSGSSWKNISCDSGCEYRNSTSEEAVSYLPTKMIENFNISCIQNVAQAFCRYTLKNEEKQGGYVVIALVTGKPIPMLLNRISMR